MLSHFSHVRLFVTLWTVARQAPLSMGFSRQEYWNGLACPSPGDLPNPGSEPMAPALQMDSLPAELPEKPQNKNTAHQNLQKAAKSVLRGKFIAINVYIRDLKSTT